MTQLEGRCFNCRVDASAGPTTCGGCGSLVSDGWDGQVAPPSHMASWWDQHVGRRVIFTYPHGEECIDTITSVNDKNVFVNFGKANSEACTPSWLRLEVEP